tara:strand:+ start:1072 stop:1710 length:639 start_codon:yes stop_codon:yes gene_type:complete
MHKKSALRRGYNMADKYIHKEERLSYNKGEKTASYYGEAIETSKQNPIAQHGSGPDKKVIKPEEMPWEYSQQGILKHVINEKLAKELGASVRGTDIYMQVIPPGGRSGKHRHMSEELIFVIEGEGYDLHWDPTLHVGQDVAHWTYPEEALRFDWIPEDVIYIPTNTVHQHFNKSQEKPARILCCQNRLYNTLGYGMEDLEQFENSPEYEENN